MQSIINADASVKSLKCKMSCGEDEVEDTATNQGISYHSGVNSGNYETVASSRLRTPSSTCSQADQQTLTMSLSMSGLLFPVNSKLVLKRSFSFAIWVLMKSLVSANILNILDVAQIKSDGTKLTLSITFADNSVESISSNGGVMVCQANKWCYIGGSVQLLDQKYFLHLYELTVNTATKGSTANAASSTGTSFKPLKTFGTRLVDSHN